MLWCFLNQVKACSANDSIFQSVNFGIGMVHTFIYCFPNRDCNYDGTIEIVPYNLCCLILLQAIVATTAAVIEELPYANLSEYQPDVPGISDRRTGMLEVYNVVPS